MDPAAKPTARALYERLRELLLEPGQTDEDLAYLLGTPVRDVSRLKNGFGPTQLKLIGMLDVAGWITPATALTADESRERAKVYAQSRRLQRQSRNNREGPGSPE